MLKDVLIGSDRTLYRYYALYVIVQSKSGDSIYFLRRIRAK